MGDIAEDGEGTADVEIAGRSLNTTEEVGRAGAGRTGEAFDNELGGWSISIASAGLPLTSAVTAADGAA